MDVIGRALVCLGVGLLVAACGQMAVDRCVEGFCATGMACVDGACEALPPDPTGNLGRHTSVAVREDGRRVIATFDGTQGNLVLLLEDAEGRLDSQVVAGWSNDRGTIEDTDAGEWSSLALDDHGGVHLTWYDGTHTALMYGAWRPGEKLIPEVVDDDGDRGTHTHLAIETSGVVHVAYRDEGTRSLRYARRSSGGTWTHEAVPSCTAPDSCDVTSDNYGEYNQIVLVADQPRVVFYDRDLGDLKLGARDGVGSWTIKTLDGVDPETGADRGDVGRFASASLDPKSRLAVAYYDHTAGALRYLPPEGSAVPLVLDDGLYWDQVTGARRNHPVGQHVHLDFDPSGTAHLLYLDAGLITMKRAEVTGMTVAGPYELVDLEAGGDLGFQVDSQNRLVGAYGVWVQEGNQPMSHRLERFTIDVGGP